MLLAFTFIAEHNQTSSLGVLDETWLCQCKPKAGGVEGAPDTLHPKIYFALKFMRRILFWKCQHLTKWIHLKSEGFFWSILQDHSWKPIVHAKKKKIQESPWDWRHFGKVTCPEIGLEAEGEYVSQWPHSKMCNIPFLYLEGDLWIE